MFGQQRGVYIFEAKLIRIQPMSTLWGENKEAFTVVSRAVEKWFWNLNSIRFVDLCVRLDAKGECEEVARCCEVNRCNPLSQ